jgi:hypothetical protein
MLELLLLANFVILVLIYLQLRKNIKETDSYFAAIDLSLRRFFTNTDNFKEEINRSRYEEIVRQLDKISESSGTTARILKQVHNPKSIEEEYNLSEQGSKWLP